MTPAGGTHHHVVGEHLHSAIEAVPKLPTHKATGGDGASVQPHHRRSVDAAAGAAERHVEAGCRPPQTPPVPDPTQQQPSGADAALASGVDDGRASGDEETEEEEEECYDDDVMGMDKLKASDGQCGR